MHFGGLPRQTWGLIELGVSIRHAGLLVAALGTALLTALMVTAGLAGIDGLARNADAGSALLLAVPGVLAGYLLRPGEHRLVSKLFGGLRAMVALSALCALTAAGSVVIGLDGELLRLVWAVMCALSWTSTLLIALAFVLPLSRFRQRSARAAGLLERIGRLGARVLRAVPSVRRRRARGIELPPMNVRQAVSSLGLDLHGTPVESAEGWRAGFDGIDTPAGVALTLALAQAMRAAAVDA